MTTRKKNPEIEQPLTMLQLEKLGYKMRGDFAVINDTGDQYIWDKRFDHWAPWKAGRKSNPRKKNTARRIGTARPRRVSTATKKKPIKGLIARRKANKKTEYHPNQDHAKFHNLKYEVMAKTSAGKWLTVSVFAKPKEAMEYAKAYAKLHPTISIKVEKQ